MLPRPVTQTQAALYPSGAIYGHGPKNLRQSSAGDHQQADARTQGQADEWQRIRMAGVGGGVRGKCVGVACTQARERVY